MMMRPTGGMLWLGYRVHAEGLEEIRVLGLRRGVCAMKSRVVNGTSRR